MASRRNILAETAEGMAQKQREISVSEFFSKNRHLLGFDNPRKALLTTVKEAVDNALDACEEARIVPEVSVEIEQTGVSRFRIIVTDNGPGIVKAQIPQIFAKLLYGSKFHRLRMSRGQQGIGISAAGMYGQLTTGSSTVILSKTKRNKKANKIVVQIDARKNKPTILQDEEVSWEPTFPQVDANGKQCENVSYNHGTSVSIEMEASYIRGKLSVDEYLKQCAVVNPHLEILCRVRLLKKQNDDGNDGAKKDQNARIETEDAPWIVFHRVNKKLPDPPDEIKPHPHGVELGVLMQMLKDSNARTLRAALSQDFSRVGSGTALAICKHAKLSPKARPARIAQNEIEALYKAINETKLMRPPTDCLSPIGEEQIVAGLKKEIVADFYTAVTRAPMVYRGNPFQIEAGVAYAKGVQGSELSMEDPVRLMRFANRVPLLHMAGGCAITKAVTGVNWRSYGLAQPRGSFPVGPMVIMVHVASVWVPFTSESKEAIAHYPEIIKEITYCLQECGRRLSVYLKRRYKQAEMARKRDYIALYIPHLAQGIQDILNLNDRQKSIVTKNLNKMLERTHLET
ncbi:MAG: DNA topoisomerase VI subunit B [Lentisphaerae bacterium]|nr:DNA topoisomerase VI subunit B [Lentisphaerota bacterium]